MALKRNPHKSDQSRQINSHDLDRYIRIWLFNQARPAANIPDSVLLPLQGGKINDLVSVVLGRFETRRPSVVPDESIDSAPSLPWRGGTTLTSHYATAASTQKRKV